jgi:MoaD family protein
MAIKILIPTPLQKFTNNEPTVEFDAGEGKTIGGILEDLESKYTGIKARLCGDDGKIRRFVNFYLNEEDIRFLDNENTQVNDGDEISIVPAVAGG